jgi:hypothetical protein
MQRRGGGGGELLTVNDLIWAGAAAAYPARGGRAAIKETGDEFEGTVRKPQVKGRTGISAWSVIFPPFFIFPPKNTANLLYHGFGACR